MTARVLIIDDDLMVTELLREHLTNEGYEVAASSMAEEGYNFAVKSPPDLIMLDVNLPDATGFQMCARFKENVVTEPIPIIMMTGQARFPNQQAIGKQLGATAYILKPFNILEVGDKVNALIGQKRTGVPILSEELPEAVAAAPEPLPEPETISPAKPEVGNPPPLVPSSITPPVTHGFEEFLLSTQGAAPLPVSTVEHFVPPSQSSNGSHAVFKMPELIPMNPLKIELAVEENHDLPKLEPFQPAAPIPENSQPAAGDGPAPSASDTLVAYSDPAVGPPPMSPETTAQVPVAVPDPIPPEISGEAPVTTAAAPEELETPAAVLDVLHDASSIDSRVDFKAFEPQLPPATLLAVEVPAPVTPGPAKDHLARPTALPEASRPADVPVQLAKPVVLPRGDFFRSLRVAIIFALHVALAIGTAAAVPGVTSLARAGTLVAGGWALMLGLLIFTAALLRISLTPVVAMELLGPAAIPIVVRAFGGLLGALNPWFSAFRYANTPLSPSVLWLRPIDVFEMVALIILGFSLRRVPGTTLFKSIVGTVLIGIAWALTGLGYFRPF